MDISNSLSDDSLLEEIGRRISQFRLNRNLTQAELAREAGVSLSTLNRMEAGQSSQLTNFVRVLRALDLLENMDALLPEPEASPVQQLKMQGKTRQRASSRRKKDGEQQPWHWNLQGNSRDDD